MLTRIRLTDFKSFADETVDLAGLTVLVGANASGKSNLFDGLRFLQGAAQDMPIADVLRGRWEGGRQVWPGIRGGATDAARSGTGRFALRTTWSIDGEQLEHELKVDAGEHPMLAGEHLRSDRVAPYIYDTDAPALRDAAGRHAGNVRVAVKRDGKGNSVTQTHGASRALLHQLDTDAPVAREVKRARDVVSAALRGAYFLDITPSRMRDYAPKQVSELGLEGENVSALAWSLCQTESGKQELVDWIGELCAPELESIDFAKTDLGDVMLVLIERGGRRIPARSMSDGTLRFLGELLALRTAPPGALLLIEEIENGLHPARTHLLVEAMESAVAARGIQVIATTHSPFVLNALSPSALRQALLFARPPDAPGTVVRALGALPDFDQVVERRGIDRLLASGWLERAL
jgi:predicted ATPase